MIKLEDKKPRQKPKAFLICPVRDLGRDIKREIEDWIDFLEERYDLYVPYRDTNQDDPIGYDICKQNRKAIKEASTIFVYYTPDSQGTHFDLGMAFVMNKRIRLCNYEEYVEKCRLVSKSFPKLLQYLSKKR